MENHCNVVSYQMFSTLHLFKIPEIANAETLKLVYSYLMSLVISWNLT